MPWTYIINDLNREEVVGVFYENVLKKKTNQKVFRTEEVIGGKSDKLYVKLKGCKNLFNS